VRRAHPACSYADTRTAGRLTDRELVRSVDGGWLLCGDPPFELLELQHVGILGAG
jgi:hypothetical protein